MLIISLGGTTPAAVLNLNMLLWGISFIKAIFFRIKEVPNWYSMSSAAIGLSLVSGFIPMEAIFLKDLPSPVLR